MIEIKPFTDVALRVELTESGENYYITTCQSDDVLAKVYNDKSPDSFHHGLANARLYGAAPDLFKGVETALFQAFVIGDDAWFSPLYRAYFKALRGDYPLLDMSRFIRDDYHLMLCGSVESTRWPERRKTTPEEFEEFGHWHRMNVKVPSGSWVLVRGEYTDVEGNLWANAVVPSYSTACTFRLSVGSMFASHWMKMPQLEDVFQSALWRAVQRDGSEGDEVTP